jgi:asparagine synthase (glutamine-hydrolysing)
MCGIAGIVRIDGTLAVEKERIFVRDMTDSISHRGPDDSDVYADENVALGHRRLSIIDLSEAGRQPMFDSTGRFGIVFNGEIYNYLDIKEELAAKGHCFRTRTDTEVVLNAYHEFGAGFLAKLNGMFAFAIYDRRNGNVLLARDRIGVKPLYYTVVADKLLFASEIKALLKYPLVKRNLDVLGMSSYLSYRYPIGTRTLFAGIHSLAPGHYLEVKGAEISQKKYWELPVVRSKEDLGEEYYLEKVRSILTKSVQMRLMSDVPIGAYLSGGLDSSIIVALMSQFLREPVKTFTIGFAEEGFNEFSYAKLVADRYKTDHHEIVLTADDYIQNMETLISFKDAPLGVPNEPALYVMSKELKKYITVVLSGEGADELFGGYGRIFRSPYDFARLQELGKANGVAREDVFKIMADNLHQKYGARTFANEVEHFTHLYQYTKWEDKGKLLSPELVEELDSDNGLTRVFTEEFDKLRGMDLSDKYMYLFEKHHIVGLLQRVDCTTMAASVEARTPFVDHHELVEFAMSIPFKYKIRWKSMMHKIVASVYNSDQISERYDTPKYLLKKAFERDLPPEVVWRKKMGFPVPVQQWFGSEFIKYTKEILLDERSASRGMYNMEYLEKALGDTDVFSSHNFGLKIWMLINLELWFRKYLDS